MLRLLLKFSIQIIYNLNQIQFKMDLMPRYSMIFILLLIVQIKSLNNLAISEDNGLYTSSKRRGCIIQHPLYQHNQQPITSRKLVSNQNPHGFRIHGEYPENSDLDINVLKRLFSIATKYYQNIISVTTLEQSQTLYATSYKCGRALPSYYQQNGFDPGSIDSIIIILTQNNPSQNYIAAATACLLSRWPTYGYVVFNAAYITTNLQETGIFHANVYISMHQLCHVYGLSSTLLSHFYTNYGSGIKKTGVTTTLGGTSRTMVVTPNVLKYVQTFFGCSDGTTGGLIEDDGGLGSAGSHWERTVYFDQMMTASAWPSGLKITALTLNLLKDTNYYYSVDTSYCQPTKFGQSAGCDFAKSFSTITPQYCTGSTSSCDFYGFYGGVCSNKDTFSQRNYVYALSNEVCTLPQKAYISNAYEQFNALSHCLNVEISGYLTPVCFLADCDGQQIHIKIQQTNYTCKVGDTSISTIAGTINCPDPNLFCARKNCKNWCDSSGLCINGQCMEVSLESIPSYLTATVIIVIIVVIIFAALIIAILCLFIGCVFFYKKMSSDVSPNAVRQSNIRDAPQVFSYGSNHRLENTTNNLRWNGGFKEKLPPISQSNTKIISVQQQNNQLPFQNRVQ